MQPLEYAIVIVGLALLAYPTLTEIQKSPGRRAAFLLIPILIAIQIALEGYRWHMLPAYFSLMCVGSLAAIPLQMWVWMRRAILACSGLCILCSATIATLFPVFELPPLTGSYAVGTVTLTLTDPARPIGDSRLFRRVPVQLFYPVEVGSAGPRANYMPAILTSRLKPQLALVHTRAIIRAPISHQEAKFPVIIYSPSWNGNRHENTGLAEELASHGYVVASFDVPYETLTTVYEDGTIIRTKDDPWLDVSSQKDLDRTMVFVRRHLVERVADVELLVDHLSALSGESASHQFIGRLDSSRVGILGFSFGGTTAAEACRLDPRLKAGVNMDGFSYGIGNSTAIRQPFLYMSSGDAPPSPGPFTESIPPKNVFERLCAFDSLQTFGSINVYGGYIVTIRGAEHANFSDWPLYCRIRRYTGAGSINPRRSMYIMTAYLLGFFDQELRGLERKGLAGRSDPFPDAFVIAREKTTVNGGALTPATLAGASARVKGNTE